MSRKRVALDVNQSAELCDAVYGDALLPLPWALQVLQCSCEYDHNDGQSLHIRRCTNLLNWDDNQMGHTLCPHDQYRPLEEDIYQRACKIAGLVHTRVQERNIVLSPRIRFGAYTAGLRDTLRTANIPECRCTCQCDACSDPDNVNPDPVSEDDYAEHASAIAEDDIDLFVSGGAPIPQRRPTSRRRTS